MKRILFTLLALVLALFVVTATATAQEATDEPTTPVDNPVQDVAAVLLVLAGAAVAVNRAVELFKPFVKMIPVGEDYQPYLIYLVSFGVSTLTVMSIGEPANLLATNPRFAAIPSLLGLLITAAVLAGGSNAVHALAGLITGRDVATVEATTITEFSSSVPANSSLN